jgi:glyoxylase-like metal-dependent hydrolase (beta-lactamase superfamily II)
MTYKRLPRGIFTIPEATVYLQKKPRIEVESLGKDLWTASDGHYRTIFVEGRKQVVAFDTFNSPAAAHAYAESVAAATNKPIGTIIYSHDHLDHSGFAASLSSEAEVIADQVTAQVVMLRGADGQRRVQRTITGCHNHLEIEGTQLQLWNPGPTHGSGNLAAFFPDHKVLFMSDTILPNARYGLLPDYHVANFVKFMRQALEEFDFATFVPGRFEIATRSRFEKGVDYIEAIQEASQHAFVEGVPVWILDAITEYVQQKLRPLFEMLDGFNQHVGLTAFRIVHHYLMGGWGLEDTPAAAYNLAETKR